MTAAITVRGVSKRFRLAHDPVWSVKERVLRFGRTTYEDFWALRDIELDIAQGQTLGILGHNGSGKSTLLKCIAGILKPTTGEVRLRGRVASLLELGAGFHPDLTGRENVFINAAFLGISRKEIAARFDEIVAFAELEQFIDNQVKHYSSGMFVRLGFAVAVNVDPDILLIDEVLAVGDEAFQRKCLDRIAQFQQDGRTILFVTHGADLTRELCNRVIVLDHGRMVADGSPDNSIRVFREHLARGLAAPVPLVSGPPPEVTPAIVAPAAGVHLSNVRLHGASAASGSVVRSGDALTIEADYEVETALEGAVIVLEVRDHEGTALYRASTQSLGLPLPLLTGAGKVRFEVLGLHLGHGSYTVALNPADADGVAVAPEETAPLEVEDHSGGQGVVALTVRASLRAQVPH